MCLSLPKILKILCRWVSEFLAEAVVFVLLFLVGAESWMSFSALLPKTHISVHGTVGMDRIHIICREKNCETHYRCEVLIRFARE
jgi:hypothetical protein